MNYHIGRQEECLENITLIHNALMRESFIQWPIKIILVVLGYQVLQK